MQVQDIFQHRDYRKILKIRIAEVKGLDPKKNLRFFADKIGIQYTYLSKALSATDIHLSEDHLYDLCRWLDFFPQEIDFILHLRSRELTQSSRRRDELSRRIENLVLTVKIRGDMRTASDVERDIDYLFNPICVMIHGALFIKSIRDNPQSLCQHFGLTIDQLKQHLKTIERADFLELDPRDSLKIVEVKPTKPHFSRQHPLMRAHQSLLKTLMSSRFNQTPESEKESFMVTFSSDESTREKVRELVQKFLGELQEYTSEKKDTNLYQLSIDFLRWF